jgi:hypothetical protein
LTFIREFYLTFSLSHIWLISGWFPEADAEAAACSDELDTAVLERFLYGSERAFAGLNGFAFDHVQGHDREPGLGGKCGLSPLKETARSADLSGCYHVMPIAQT